MPSEKPDPNDEEDESEKPKENKDKNGTEDSKFDDTEEADNEEEEEESRDDEEDESDPQTVSNPFYYGSFDNELKELNETLNQIRIPTLAFQQLARDTESINRTLEQIAEEFTIPQQELQGFARQLEMTQEQFKQFDAANRAIARSINPEIFDIYKDIEESSILNLYEVVAAINQIEAEEEVEAVEEGDEERAEEIREVSVSNGIEKNTYNFVATYILNGGDAFSETTTKGAERILLSDPVWEKRQAFTELVRTADQQTRVVVEMITHVALTFLVFLFLPSSDSEDDEDDNYEDDEDEE
ncbi:hypothetical protein [Natronorubrum sp. DTA7]|uniref:hypothetical protein n=1 Tax=Natronorubrum sp. DTA7 TaxID=3447016 RepID=UPI003F8491CF